ncbi:MAG: hypothetical protein DRP64_11560, partial [Verrucomicrobia bacterium]
FPGTAGFSDNALYMSGSGVGIGGWDDGFTFAHMDASEDWEISARVVNIDETDAWSKAVLMFRNDLTSSSGMIMMTATGGDEGLGYAQLTWRNSPNSWANTSEVGNLRYPIWLKLRRQGSMFSGYYSSDGQNWTQIGTATPPLNSSGKLGFGVSSRNNARIATAVFDRIALPPGPLPPIGDIGLEYLGTNSLSLTWATGAGHNYTLLEKSDLQSTIWSTNRSGIPGGESSVTVTVPADPAAAFYKVISED